MLFVILVISQIGLLSDYLELKVYKLYDSNNKENTDGILVNQYKLVINQAKKFAKEIGVELMGSGESDVFFFQPKSKGDLARLHGKMKSLGFEFYVAEGDEEAGILSFMVIGARAESKSVTKKVGAWGVVFLVIWIPMLVVSIIYFYTSFGSIIQWRISDNNVIHSGLSSNIVEIMFILPMLFPVLIITMYVAAFLTSFIPPARRAMGMDANAFESQKFRKDSKIVFGMIKWALIICLPISFLASQNYYYITPDKIYVNGSFQFGVTEYEWTDIEKIERRIGASKSNSGSLSLTAKYILVFSDSERIDILIGNWHDFFENYKKLRPYLDGLDVERTLKVTEDGKRAWRESTTPHKKQLKQLMEQK